MRFQTIWVLSLFIAVGCSPSQVAAPLAPSSPAPPSSSASQVTIRADIRSLETDRLIAACPTDSAPYAFAESRDHQVQICSQEYDPWLPKYYIGQAKGQVQDQAQTGQSLLRITSSSPEEARQLIFRNAGYTYSLHRGGIRPEQRNAYLQISTPDGKQYQEVLLYLYEIRPPR